MCSHASAVIKTTSALLLASVTLSASAAGWRLTDLGVDGINSSATAINNHGEVVGSQTNTATGKPEAFFFTGGHKRVLGTLGGSSAVAADLNNFGEVVGWSYAAGDAGYRAFIYRNGVMTDLGTPGWIQSYARQVNDAGQIAGQVESSNGYQRVFLYSAGRFSLPDGLVGKRISNLKMNNKGQLAVQLEVFQTNGYPLEAFVFDGTATYSPGRFGGDWSFVSGISDAGVLSGYSGQYGFGPRRIGFYNVNTRTAMGSKEGDTFEYLTGMNNNGQVIGFVTDDMGVFRSPYIYDTRTDTKTFVGRLDLPGFDAWRVHYLSDINDRGQVTGYAKDRLTNTFTRAFILSPVPD